MSVKFGIIGPGNIARKMADAINKSDCATLFAVASRNLEKAKSFCKTYQCDLAYGDYDEMLADPDIDAVYIALPNGLHMEMALKAMKQHKAVLCEKPFAPSYDSAKEAVDYAGKNNILFVEGMWTRWLPAVSKVKEWISDGKIGKVRLITASFGFYSEGDLSNHRFNPQLHGGALMDVGCYCVDTILYLVGEKPKTTSGILDYGVTGVDVTGVMSMSFPSGVLAHGDFSIKTPTDDDLWIYGEKGKILLKHFWRCREAVCFNQSGEVTDTFADSEENGFVYELKEFCDLYRKGNNQSVYMSWADTLLCAENFDKIRCSN